MWLTQSYRFVDRLTRGQPLPPRNDCSVHSPTSSPILVLTPFLRQNHQRAEKGHARKGRGVRAGAFSTSVAQLCRSSSDFCSACRVFGAGTRCQCCLLETCAALWAVFSFFPPFFSFVWLEAFLIFSARQFKAGTKECIVVFVSVHCRHGCLVPVECLFLCPVSPSSFFPVFFPSFLLLLLSGCRARPCSLAVYRRS